MSRARRRSPAPPKFLAEPLEIRRGDIVWINCDPSIGSEPRKPRTCVVVSNDVARAGRVTRETLDRLEGALSLHLGMSTEWVPRNQG